MPSANHIQTMLALTRHRNPLVEISLLRHSVGALSARRHGCVHCHRTPLVGEVVHMYGDQLVCELCRPLHREPPAPQRAGPLAGAPARRPGAPRAA